jgi:hypothetical protein
MLALTSTDSGHTCSGHIAEFSYAQDPIQSLLNAANSKTKAIEKMECYTKLIDPLENYQVQMVGFQSIALLLQFPEFAESGVFDEIVLRPWASTKR